MSESLRRAINSAGEILGQADAVQSATKSKLDEARAFIDQVQTNYQIARAKYERSKDNSDKEDMLKIGGMLLDMWTQFQRTADLANEHSEAMQDMEKNIAEALRHYSAAMKPTLN